MVGIIVAFYSLLPMLLGLYAGKLTDRLGVRWPIICGSLGMSLGLLIPGIVPSMTALFFGSSKFQVGCPA
jgi:MFS family permease